MIDFGFDLAGVRDPRLMRGAVISAAGAAAEAGPLVVTYLALEQAFAGTATLGTLAWSVAALLLLLMVSVACRAVGGIDSFVSTYALVSAARIRLLDHLRRLPMGFWNAQRTGSITSVATDEFALYTEIATHVWSLVVTHLAKPVALVAVLVWIDLPMGLLAVVTYPLALLAIPWSFRLLNAASDRMVATKSRAHARLVEFTAGVGTLREFGQAGTFHERLEAVLAELEAEQMRTELAPAPAVFSYKLAIWLGFSLLMALGTWRVGTGALDPLTFLLVLLVALQLFGSASELSNHLVMARFATRTLERIRDLFEAPVQVDRADGPDPVGSTIVVHEVSFGYEDRPAVQGLDARFEEGTVTALVGPSGSGKSTLAHLVSRLWDVDAGQITLGGVDLRDLPLQRLHEQVATVFQDVVLFHETVENNLRLGRPDATREEVVAAAKAARAHEFIEALPHGYDTVLTEGGADLSGGQRQRLSIARALVLDAPVLVLDEATSSVDSHNELLIQQALSELTRGRTVLVIAHRLWTVRQADQILVLDEGRIVQRGTHDELVAREGRYRDLWDAQQASRGWHLGAPHDA